MKALNVARSEIAKVIARQRLATVLRKYIAKTADYDLLIVSDVLLYVKRPRNDWVCSFKVTGGDKK